MFLNAICFKIILLILYLTFIKYFSWIYKISTQCLFILIWKSMKTCRERNKFDQTCTSTILWWSDFGFLFGQLPFIPCPARATLSWIFWWVVPMVTSEMQPWSSSFCWVRLSARCSIRLITLCCSCCLRHMFPSGCHQRWPEESAKGLCQTLKLTWTHKHD